MPLREFLDADGRTWQVWDTVPKSSAENAIFAQSARILAEAESRQEGRRDGSGPEGRTPPDAHARRSAAAAAALRRFTEGRELGWLTFMDGEDKRRLSPIPDGWEGWSDAQLAALLVAAQPVAKTPREGSGMHAD
jgi:hypothetical protein